MGRGPSTRSSKKQAVTLGRTLFRAEKVDQRELLDEELDYSEKKDYLPGLPLEILAVCKVQLRGQAAAKRRGRRKKN